MKLELGRRKFFSIKAPFAARDALRTSTMIPSSSVVEQAAVNRLAGGSNPPWGANLMKSLAAYQSGSFSFCLMFPTLPFFSSLISQWCTEALFAKFFIASRRAAMRYPDRIFAFPARPRQGKVVKGKAVQGKPGPAKAGQNWAAHAWCFRPEKAQKQRRREERGKREQ